MGAPQHVHADELAAMLGGYTSSMLCTLARSGVIAQPSMARGRDGRWRRAWDRGYVEALVRDPPPIIARRLARARAAP